MTETRRDDDCLVAANEISSVPSGFILKLYQMVNGAPDDIISWTNDGEAFIIGSDLGRLESETLPQYFRHNRFQSLVRQLNFYSFRKINRERNVWIYKHELFHRDRPGDLHMVRRRTCPGIDGRKQRFSRLSVRKLGQTPTEEPGSKVDRREVETSKHVQPIRQPAVEHSLTPSAKPPKKRRLKEDYPEVSPSKLPTVSSAVSIDTSMMNNVVEPSETLRNLGLHQQRQVQQHPLKDFDEEPLPQKNDKTEMLQQSMVVSEVAMKLEECARKALRGKGALRSRRGGGGVVTPPYGASSQYTDVSSRGLLTYDDEVTNDVTVVVTDGDESTAGESNQSQLSGKAAVRSSARGTTVLDNPPVPAVQLRTSICDRILSYAEEHGLEQSGFVSVAVVMSFCMSTSPKAGKELSLKILELLASCNQLATEFHSYRSALHPDLCSDQQSALSKRKRLHDDTNCLDILQDMWSSDVKRMSAIHDFRVFSVNCIRRMLSRDGANKIRLAFSFNETTVLEKTADVWLVSMI